MKKTIVYFRSENDLLANAGYLATKGAKDGFKLLYAGTTGDADPALLGDVKFVGGKSNFDHVIVVEGEKTYEPVVRESQYAKRQAAKKAKTDSNGHAVAPAENAAEAPKAQSARRTAKA